jgi:sulfate permease, SulP family
MVRTADPTKLNPAGKTTLRVQTPTKAPAYGWQSFAGDAAGGTISALIALPYGLALARQMGLQPVYGLFTSILTGPVTALLGRNPVMIGGTASATLPFIAVAVQAQQVGGAAKVVLAASAFLIAFGLFRLGRYVARIPHTVVSGFSCGVGAMMIVLQLPDLLGLKSPEGNWASGALGRLAQVVPRLGQARGEPLVLAAIVIAVAWLAARRWPRSPAPLLGVGLALAVAGLLGWRVSVVGTLGQGSLPLASFRWQASDLSTIVPSAMGLAFVMSVNILITSRVVEHFRGRHRHLKPSDADRELLAYGAANLCAGAFGTPPSVGIPARSLANVRCGGTTRVSNLLHSAILLILVVIGSGAIALVPHAALAGVTAFVGIGLLEWSTWRRLPRMRRLDAAAFLTTAIAVIATNAIAAVALGCSLYIGRLILVRHIRPIMVPQN